MRYFVLTALGKGSLGNQAIKDKDVLPRATPGLRGISVHLAKA